jgi:hypothetical protein
LDIFLIVSLKNGQLLAKYFGVLRQFHFYLFALIAQLATHSCACFLIAV